MKNPKMHMKAKSLLAALALTTAGCEKGGNSFSVLSDSSSFQQAATFVPRKLDVLFVVDNSGSMLTSQQNLAANFSSFIDRFISKGFDFRIAIATTDAFYGEQFLGYSPSGTGTPCTLCNSTQARFRSGVVPTPVFVIDSNNYDLLLESEKTRLKEEFGANVQVGISGSGDERAFASFKAALNSPLNSGFKRSDSYLSIVIVSDEEDFSQGTSMPTPSGYGFNESYTNPLLHPVTNYVDFLKSFTGGAIEKDFSVSTISINDSACLSLLGGGRKIATRYRQLAESTGGSVNSLCANFDASLDNISTTVSKQAPAIFKLDKTPIVSSIRVIIAGVLVPEDSIQGWSYDSVKNQITVNGETYSPASGASVVINYDPQL